VAEGKRRRRKRVSVEKRERLAVVVDGRLVIELATCGGVGGRQAGGRDGSWLGR